MRLGDVTGLRTATMTPARFSQFEMTVLPADGAEFEMHLHAADVRGEFSWQVARPTTCGVCSADRLRRAADIVLSGIGLLVLLPFMLLVAFLIRLESPGPALFRQERVGMRRRSFTLLKFRSMRQDAEADGPCWAAEDDKRVTRIGRIIRATHLDELPQLLNVLSGSMSLIGPRPERTYFVRQLEAEIPGFSARLLVKPGITGWAQINHPYSASVEDARRKLALDMHYIRHRTLRLDLRIIASTLKIMAQRTGAR